MAREAKRGRDGVIHAIRVSAYENRAFERWRVSRKKKDISESICWALASYSRKCLIKMLASFSFKRTRHRGPRLLARYQQQQQRRQQQRRKISLAGVQPAPTLPIVFVVQQSGKWSGANVTKRDGKYDKLYPPRRWADPAPVQRSKPNDGQTSPRWIVVHRASSGITHSMNNQTSLNVPASRLCELVTSNMAAPDEPRAYTDRGRSRGLQPEKREVNYCRWDDASVSSRSSK